MFTVALIGADGAGKTTICRRLERTLPLPVRYVYMGVNPDSSNVLLPTTRLIRALRRARGVPPDTSGPPDPDRDAPRPKRGVVRRVASGVKSSLGLANRIAEEWYRQGMAWRYRRCGYIVLFDRHFFADYHAYDIAAGHGPKGRTLGSRVHGWMLARMYPKPDLVIYLDAPGEVLFARKGEGTVAALERRREDYRRVGDFVENFVVVDAARPEDDVARDVTERICRFHQTRPGRRRARAHDARR